MFYVSIKTTTYFIVVLINKSTKKIFKVLNDGLLGAKSADCYIID